MGKSNLIIIGIVILVFFGLVGTVFPFSYNIETADGEGTNFSDGSTQLGTNYTYTRVFDNDPEFISESSNLLRWNYDFNTSYNETPPAIITIVAYNISFAEYVNMTIYNYDTGIWEYLNQTSTIGVNNLTATFTWEEKNLSSYVNSNDGQIKILFNDTDLPDAGTETTAFSIDYLAINVTTSPLYTEYFFLNESTSGNAVLGSNLARENVTNVSALWYRGNATSFVSLTGGLIVVNGTEYNVSDVSANFTNISLNNKIHNWWKL